MRMKEQSVEGGGGAAERRAKQTGVAGVLVGMATLVACELPILLALVGFGGLSAGASALKPAPWLELFGAVAGLAGLSVLLGLLVRHFLGTRRLNATSPRSR